MAEMEANKTANMFVNQTMGRGFTEGELEGRFHVVQGDSLPELLPELSHYLFFSCLTSWSEAVKM